MEPGSLFLGMWVNVDPERRIGRPDSNGGAGIVTCIEPTTSIKYLIEGRLTQDVDEDRIHSMSLMTTSRRPGANGQTIPGLLSYNYGSFNTNPSVASVPTNVVDCNVITTATMIRESTIYNNVSKKKRADDNPTFLALTDNFETNDKGWLRANENKRTTSHLNNIEKELLIKLVLHLKPTYPNITRQVAWAWGVAERTIRSITAKALKNQNLSADRKKRDDTGLTIINSERKREATITPYNVFRKTHRRRNNGEVEYTKEEMKEQWMHVLEDEREFSKYKKLAAEHVDRGRTLMVDIADVMRRTNGSITWRQIVVEVSGVGIPITNHVSVCREVMALPGSCYKTTQIYPKLDTAKKFIRYNWAINFWLFWNSAKVLTGRVKVLLVHMDEKWFYAVVVRKKNKLVPFLGVEPLQHSVQHKSHIYKEMVICSTGYLPNENDVAAGGLSYKISCERVGRLLPAKRDSYKRVYNNDGTFSYPKILSNKVRHKGQLYFHPLEIQSRSEGTILKPKYSLKKFYREIELPALDKLTCELSEKYDCPVVVRYQCDGAGPHTDKKLVALLDEQFRSRGWMFTFQPPQSPHTNVKDTCIFPAMSKAVTWEQAATNGSAVLEGEQLWNCVTNAWENLPLDTIARAYLGHHQIVNAIARDRGSDEFVKERGGLHFGVRKHAIPFYEGENTTPSGVYVATEGVEVLTDVLDQSGWKYPTPDVDDSNSIHRLNRQELEFLEIYTPTTSPQWEDIVVELQLRIDNEDTSNNNTNEISLPLIQTASSTTMWL